MLLLSLLTTPILGVLGVYFSKDRGVSLRNIKFIALTSSIITFFISLVLFILFDFSTNQFQFVQECYEITYYDFYLGVDGLSIYFILLTTIIAPISLVSNWKSISHDVVSYLIIILLLEILLLAVFLVLDILLFYIFFESILPPLFILIGIFGSDNRVKASFYLFLYTLLGSLFLLLSILAMSSIMSATDFDTLFKGNFLYITQLFVFYGIFIAFAVKTPTIFLNTWLLKAHVESPLAGSIILAAIVLKLSLYGILRLILTVLPKAYMVYTYIIFVIGVITIIYASLSTIRTIDIKELIAYSSVSHAAVYLLAVFSNSIQGIEGAISLGLAHGLVSPGLFICAGGVLYDRSSTRTISFYRGVTQVMPLFAILFFILCLANCGAPLSLNFIGEFLSLYGVFETSPLFGFFASSSIVFSAAYTIYMYQRIAFGGSYSRMFTVSMWDLTKREFTILLILVIPTVFFGIYPSPILDTLHYSVSTLIYSFDTNIISCYSTNVWELYLNDKNHKLVYISFILICVLYYKPRLLLNLISVTNNNIFFRPYLLKSNMSFLEPMFLFTILLAIKIFSILFKENIFQDSLLVIYVFSVIISLSVLLLVSSINHSPISFGLIRILQITLYIIGIISILLSYYFDVHLHLVEFVINAIVNLSFLLDVALIGEYYSVVKFDLDRTSSTSTMTGSGAGNSSQNSTSYSQSSSNNPENIIKRIEAQIKLSKENSSYMSNMMSKQWLDKTDEAFVKYNKWEKWWSVDWDKYKDTNIYSYLNKLSYKDRVKIETSYEICQTKALTKKECTNIGVRPESHAISDSNKVSFEDFTEDLIIDSYRVKKGWSMLLSEMQSALNKSANFTQQEKLEFKSVSKQAYKNISTKMDIRASLARDLKVNMDKYDYYKDK